MSKKTMFSILRSKYARLMSPLCRWCSCTSVKEPEEDELHCQAGAGGQVPSYRGQSQWELMPTTSTACSEAKAEPEAVGHKSSGMNEIMPLFVADEEHFQGNKPAPCLETINILAEAPCNVNCTSTKPAAEPATPFDVSPVPTRKQSRTSLDSQDGQAQLTASAETFGEPAAETIEFPTNSSTDNDSSSTTNTTCTTNTTSTANSTSTSKVSDGVAATIDQRQYQEDSATAAVSNSSEHSRDFNCEGAAEYLQRYFVPLLMEQLQLGAGLQEAAVAAAAHLDDYLTSTNRTLSDVVNAYPYTTRRCSDW